MIREFGSAVRHRALTIKKVSGSCPPDCPTDATPGSVNRNPPRALCTVGRWYKIFCESTGVFHWEVVIEASRFNFSDHLGHQQISVRGIPRITNNLRDPLPLPSIRGQFRNEDASLPLKVRYRRLLEAVV